ncbi:MAG: MBL fold metallo-hydrolase, partial [Oscillospiraceae bacterium]
DEHIKIEYDNLSDIKVITSDIIFENQLTIDLGGVHCVLMQVTAPHTKDSVLVYIPEEKTLFIGDADCGDSYNDGKCEQSKLMAFIHTIKTIDFDTYIIGHDKPETKETAMIYLQDELKKEVR